LPTDRIHAPNERFYLPNFLKAIYACIWFMTALGKKKSFSDGAAKRKMRETTVPII
jgi:hypothetical protein